METQLDLLREGSVLHAGVDESFADTRQLKNICKA